MTDDARPDRLRVVVASTQNPRDLDMIAEREPRLDIVYRPDLVEEEGIDWMSKSNRVPQRTDAQQAEYEAMLDTADVLFGVPDYSPAALRRSVRANPDLRWVHTIPAGGGAQVKAAELTDEELARVVFTTSAGVHVEPLAEFALFGVFAGAKRLPRLERDRADGTWNPHWAMGLVRDQKVAVVGLGSIGTATAEKLALLGCEVIGVHRREVEAPGVSRIEPVERLGAVLAEVDAVVLALPGTAQTFQLLSREALAHAKPGLTVVNVGRGTTVDEPALIEALQDGRVGFAALDVTAVEPLPADSPLWTLPNVVISPHNAAVSEHEARLIAELFVANATAFLDGAPQRNVVDTVEFY